jgi:hypothetical protein
MLMHARTTACAALAAAGLLALPGVAGAAGSKSVYLGPLKVKGYQMTAFATDGGSSDSLMVMFTKFAGKSSQSHTYNFMKGVSVSIKGSKATVKGSLGAYGSVNLKLNATSSVKGVVPKGCKGKVGASKSGVAKGKLGLVLDKTYFRKVSAKSLKGLIPGKANIKCSGQDGGSGGGSSHGVTLSQSIYGDGSGGMTMLSATKTSKGTFESVTVSEPSNGVATVMHHISASAPASALTAADDLSSATLAATGPFLSGSGKYAAMEGMPNMGTFTGDFAAKFDSIGKVALGSEDGMAQLRKF